MSGLRVVLAEDHFLVRRGLSDVVGAEETLELAGVCQSLPELLDTVERACPDVVVTDIRMPPTGTDEGIQAAEVFRRTHPRLAVLVLSQYADELKKRSPGRGTVALRRLLALRRDYPREAFLKAVTVSRQYGLFDLDRLERLTLRMVAKDFFVLSDDEGEDDQ